MRAALPLLAALLCVVPACRTRSAPARPLVWSLTHPVETPWAPAPDGVREIRLVAVVGSNAARDTPPSRTFPCVSLEVRAGTLVEGSRGVACDRAADPSTPAEMTLRAEALLGTPSLAWSHGHALVVKGPSWTHGLVLLPTGAKWPWRAGSVAGKVGDPMLPGIQCDAWGERNDCVIQEYEATARALPGVGATLGFLSDAPDRSAVLLVTGGASPAAVERAVLAAHPGPHLPIRVRAWASLPTSPTAEDVWRLMEAEAKLPP